MIKTKKENRIACAFGPITEKSSEVYDSLLMEVGKSNTLRFSGSRHIRRALSLQYPAPSRVSRPEDP